LLQRSFTSKTPPFSSVSLQSLVLERSNVAIGQQQIFFLLLIRRLPSHWQDLVFSFPLGLLSPTKLNIPSAVGGLGGHKLLGAWLGPRLVDLLGAKLGDLLGTELGSALGAKLGDLLGAKLGSALGAKLVDLLGAKLGDLLGTELGVHSVPSWEIYSVPSWWICSVPNWGVHSVSIWGVHLAPSWGSLRTHLLV